MLSNQTKETATAPGTGTTVTLNGAPAGYVTFLSQIAAGQSCYYFLSDGVNTEAQVGTIAAGPPATLTRGTPIWTSTGSASRLNFAGLTSIYMQLPADRMMYSDATPAWVARSRRITALAAATATTDAATFAQVGWKVIGAPVDFGTTTAAVTFSLPATYKRYRVEYTAVPEAAQPVFVRFSTDNAVSYKLGASDYSFAAATIATGAVTPSGFTANYLPISDAAATLGINFGSIEFDAFTGRGLFDATQITAAPLLTRFSGSFNAGFAGTITDILLSIVGSNFRSGRFRLLGGQ